MSRIIPLLVPHFSAIRAVFSLKSKVYRTSERNGQRSRSGVSERTWIRKAPIGPPGMPTAGPSGSACHPVVSTSLRNESGMYEMLGRFTEFRHDWERAYLENSADLVFRNTFRDIEHILKSCSAAGTRFEIECYDVSHLYTAAHFRDRGLLEGPIFIQTVFGTRGGIGAHYEDIVMMKRTADRLFGDDYIWSVLGTGRGQIPIATMSAALGGNVRVGLEDSLWDAPGQLATSNAAQVRRMRTILEALSLDVATPDEAREYLQLKGKAAMKIPV